jgi:TatD DNase family protein
MVDTHSHIHILDYGLDAEQVIDNAVSVGVDRQIVVGCDLESSESAIEFAKNHQNIWASVGIHPHEASRYLSDSQLASKLGQQAGSDKVVAIGECGLDYYYNHSSKSDQISILHIQIQIALEQDLPMIFHVRDAFDDFFAAFDQYSGIRGVIHSFSSSTKDLQNIIERGLSVGLNGIMTFTKISDQLEAAKIVPITKILLETDSPYLTPHPHRGTINEPKNIEVIAEFLSNIRGVDLEYFKEQTTANSIKMFNLV